LPSPYLKAIGILWLAWLAYWWLSARSAKAAAKTESGWSQLAYSLPIWLSAWLMLGRGVPTEFLNRNIVPPRPELLIAGTVLVVAGLGFAIWARRHLGTNWSAPVSVKEDHELVTSGPYRFVRHPIYSGILLALLGTALAVGRTRGAIALVLAFAGFWQKLVLEERWMVETFGSAYTQYQTEVVALIPYVL